MPMNTLDLMRDGPVIPVIVLQRVADAVPLARALVAGGIRVLEVTLRTPVALACIEAIATEVPEAVVGAGTVRSAADAQAARDAGCRFGVSPGYTHADRPGLPRPRPAAAARRGHRPARSWRRKDDGYDFLKFFPATAAGGIPMLKAWPGRSPTSRSAPPAASRRRRAPEFLALPNVGLRRLVADAGRRGGAGDWARITALAREASGLRL